MGQRPPLTEAQTKAAVAAGSTGILTHNKNEKKPNSNTGFTPVTKHHQRPAEQVKHQSYQDTGESPSESGDNDGVLDTAPKAWSMRDDYQVGLH